MVVLTARRRASRRRHPRWSWCVPPTPFTVTVTAPLWDPRPTSCSRPRCRCAVPDEARRVHVRGHAPGWAIRARRSPCRHGTRRHAQGARRVGPRQGHRASRHREGDPAGAPGAPAGPLGCVVVGVVDTVPDVCPAVVVVVGATVVVVASRPWSSSTSVPPWSWWWARRWSGSTSGTLLPLRPRSRP